MDARLAIRHSNDADNLMQEKLKSLFRIVTPECLCRECDYQVSYSETICERCGAAHPARVPLTAVTAYFACFVCFVIACMVFI